MLVTMVDVHGLTNVDLDSGIRLRIADWVSPLDPSNGWWGAIRHGDSAAQRVNWSVSGTALPLAPATYDVYWCQDYRHEPMLIADAVDVRPGGPVQVSADSGLRVKIPERIAKPYSTGQWGVVPSGSELKQPINWWAGGIDAPLLVPPGRYDVLWQQDYAHPMERIIEGIEVPAGTLVQAAVPS